ncbi:MULTISPECIES: MaoC family dehydratase [Bordetella]|uniref:MaoC family dehydratase n=1 Tax=Bordetella TaxID=517 RepID=UPI00081CC33E|nr:MULTISPECIES: MaoC family dehydratase N-terminal domain-containing protein [Bordetella]AOB25304.1 acyl dehydratase [Bordetella bronchiseptica]ARP78470.1 acyl dehydratase [Bordetella genomosp. 6]AZW42553.1 acyl dehydratase [Bordetella bronchiseptica]
MPLEIQDADGVPYVGLGLHFDEFPLGRQFRTVGRTVTEADLVNFVNATGFTEVLFTDTEFVQAQSDMRGRVVPGALVFSMVEGLLMQACMQHTGFAFLEMELKVEGPTYVGDTLHVRCEVIEARPSKSRADRGLVRTRNFVVNQRGEVVMVYTPMRFVRRQ